MKTLNYAIGVLSVLILSLLIGGGGAFWYTQERIEVVERGYDEVLNQYEREVMRLQSEVMALEEEVAQEVASNQQLQGRTLIPPAGFNRYTHPTGVSFVYPQVTDATIEEQEGPYDIIVVQEEIEGEQTLIVQLRSLPEYGHRINIFARETTQLVEPYIQQVLMPAFNLPSTCELERTVRNGVEVYFPAGGEVNEEGLDPCAPPAAFTGFIYNSQKPGVIAAGLLGQDTTFSYGFEEMINSLTVL